MSRFKQTALQLLEQSKFSELDVLLRDPPAGQQKLADEIFLLSLVGRDASNEAMERPLDNYLEKYFGEVPISNLITASRVKFELAKFEESLDILVDHQVPQDNIEATEIAVLCLFNLKKYQPGQALLDFLFLQDSKNPRYWEWNILFSYKASKPQQVIESWERFIELDGTFTQKIGVLGFVIRSYMAFGRLDDAQRVYDDYQLAEEIDNIDAAMFIADFEKQKGNFDRCAEILLKTREKHPEVAEVRWNLALCYLASGNLEDGWANYEARWDWGDFTSPKRHFNSPRWDGSELGGKTLLIWGEQGVGDQLRFLSLLPNLIEQHPKAKIFLEVDSKLVKLVRTWFPDVSEVWPMGLNDTRGLGDYDRLDFQIPSGSLPAHYFSKPALLSQSKFRVLKVSGDKRRQVLAGFADRYQTIVGISWRSMLLTPDRIGDYLNAEAFKRLISDTSQAGVGFVVLQYALTTEEATIFEGMDNVLVPDVDFLSDMDSNAVYAGACDLLVSCGTVVATMAGIFGKPVISWSKFDDPVNLGQEQNPWFPNRFDVRVMPNWDKVELVGRLTRILDRYLKTLRSTAYKGVQNG